MTDSKGFKLNEGDLIKLGRIAFKIKHIRLSNAGSKNLLDLNDQNIIIDSIKQHYNHMKINPIAEEIKRSTENLESSSASVNKACRICLSDVSTDEDPLITPCGCMGSVKFVHLGCIQTWIKSRLNVEERNHIVSIFWKNLSCELCKKTYPHSFTHNGADIDLFNIKNRSASYVVLEALTKDMDVKGIYIIDLTKKHTILIGRGHETDLKVNDISVSRIHSRLSVTKDGLCLYDHTSKFGTLVLANGPINLSKMKEVTLQCGRTIITMKHEKSWSAWGLLAKWCNCAHADNVSNNNNVKNEEIIQRKRTTSEEPLPILEGEVLYTEEDGRSRGDTIRSNLEAPLLLD